MMAVFSVQSKPSERIRRDRFIAPIFVFLVACGPQGQITRSIHPAQQIESRSNDGKNPNSTQKTITKFQKTRVGLPQQCLLEVRRPNEFCIVCDGSGVDIERCYPHQSSPQFTKNCVYSVENIKCLNPDPPFALNLALKGSLEKTLTENIHFWQEGLRTVARQHLEVNAVKDLEKALDWTENLVRVLVKCRKSKDWIEQEWESQLSLVKDSEPLKRSIALLQKDKEEGRLKLQDILNTSHSILEATGTSATVLNYWQALSTEGLEDPN